MRLDEKFSVKPTIFESFTDEALKEALASGSAVAASKSSGADLPDGVLCRVSYPICNIGKRNANNRVYEKEVWDKVLLQDDLKRKLENRALFGHAEHPEQTQSNLEKTCHVIFEMWQHDGVVWQTLDILDTPTGRIVDCCLRAGCGVGMSTRAEGDLEEAEDEQGIYQKVVAESYAYETTDFTADPSTASALPHNIKFKVVKEIKEIAKMEEAAESEKELASHVLESIRCKDMSKCQGCGACAMNKDSKSTVGSLVEAKTIGVTSTLTYGEKTATVIEINEKAILLNVAEEDGTSVQVSVDGETNVNIDQSGAISIVPIPAEAQAAPVEEIPCPPVEDVPVDSANTGMGMPAVTGDETPEELMDEIPEAKDKPKELKKGDKIKMLEGEHKDKEGTIDKIDEMDILLDDGTLVAVDDPKAVHIMPVAAKEVDLPPEEVEPEAPVKAPEDELPPAEEVPEEDMDEKIPAEAGISDRIAAGNLLQDKDGTAWVVKNVEGNGITVHQPGEPGSEKFIAWEEADSWGFTKLSESEDKDIKESEVNEKDMMYAHNLALIMRRKGKTDDDIRKVMQLAGLGEDEVESVVSGSKEDSDEEVSDEACAKYKLKEATVNCPRCGGDLRVEDDDVRGEWERITYYCPECKRDFERKIEYDQGGMTTADYWIDEEGTPVDEAREVTEAAEVVQRGDEWFVVSGAGKDLGGPYGDRAKANQRLKDIKFWKSNESEVNEEEVDEGADIAAMYKKADLPAPDGKGIHTKAFHELAIKIAKSYVEGGDSKKDALDKAYPTAMKQLGKKKAVKKAHRKDESVNIVKELQVKEAATRAERDKAIELLEELTEKKQLEEHKAFEVKILVNKINRTLHVKELEEKAIRSKLEEKAKLAHELGKTNGDLQKQLTEKDELIIGVKKELKEAKSKSEKSIKSLKESISTAEDKKMSALVEAEKKYHVEIGKAVKEAEEATKAVTIKEFVKSFVDFKLLETNLKVDDNSRALLESCKSFDEVEELLEDIMDASRRNALHSNPITGIKVVKHEIIDEETKKAEESVNVAFEGMGT
jgi:transposase-like protein